MTLKRKSGISSTQKTTGWEAVEPQTMCPDTRII